VGDRFNTCLQGLPWHQECALVPLPPAGPALALGMK
jgi:hypothetical protein